MSWVGLKVVYWSLRFSVHCPVFKLHSSLIGSFLVWSNHFGLPTHEVALCNATGDIWKGPQHGKGINAPTTTTTRCSEGATRSLPQGTGHLWGTAARTVGTQGGFALNASCSAQVFFPFWKSSVWIYVGKYSMFALHRLGCLSGSSENCPPAVSAGEGWCGGSGGKQSASTSCCEDKGREWRG